MTAPEASHNMRIDTDRLVRRLTELGAVGGLQGGGVCRLALTEADKAGRDTVNGWMRGLGMSLTIDAIGNMIATFPGTEDIAPVMMGSHIDTVATGGLYDGNLGVLAGLEIVETLKESGITTRRPIVVAAFTNEEGARFPPDMMGSAVDRGSLPLEDALAATDAEGNDVATELARIGYAGAAAPGSVTPHCFLELHVEQGPVLERENITIGAVTGVQGISWKEYEFAGVSNHAGTTPMALRHDAGFVAASISVAARRIATEMRGDQVATVGVMELDPGLVNVIARKARVTVDLRNTDDSLLKAAEARMAAEIKALAEKEGVGISERVLARFAPVTFDPGMVDRVEASARHLGHSVKRLPSGAGHDAQMFAPDCPTAMIFVPSVGGISHNIKEFTEPDHIAAGANVLLRTVLALANQEDA
ncbi:MAG: Zn-dependent hydrolase [Magnetospiraceae bacterium]